MDQALFWCTDQEAAPPSELIKEHESSIARTNGSQTDREVEASAFPPPRSRILDRNPPPNPTSRSRMSLHPSTKRRPYLRRPKQTGDSRKTGNKKLMNCRRRENTRRGRLPRCFPANLVVLVFSLKYRER